MKLNVLWLIYQSMCPNKNLFTRLPQTDFNLSEFWVQMRMDCLTWTKIGWNWQKNTRIWGLLKAGNQNVWSHPAQGGTIFWKSNKEQCKCRKAWNIICPLCEADTLQICPGGMLHINCLTLTFRQTDADSLLIVSTGDWFLADVSKSGPKLFLSLDSLETLNLNQVPPESTNCNYFQDIKGSCRSYQLSYHWLFSLILALSLSCWTWSTKSATNWSRPCL